METKFVRLPFDIEKAKKIQSGEIEGRVFDTFYKCPVRIVDFNFQSARGKLNIAISEIGKGKERYSVFNDEGVLFLDKEGKFDDEPVFTIEVPEYTTYKDGDILISSLGRPFIFNGRISSMGNFGSHCGINCNGNLVLGCENWTASVQGYADGAQRDTIIKRLKRDKRQESKEYLKRFFGIEEKHEFKPFDKVLVKDEAHETWIADVFSNYRKGSEYGYTTLGGGAWKQCLPYEGNEHLLGTTKNPE